MKIYMQAKQEPWITWDKDLWKASQNLGRKTSDLVITSVENDADVIMLEYVKGMNFLLPNRKYVIYVECLEDSEVDDFIMFVRGAVMVESTNVIIATDSVTTYDKLRNETSIPVVRWNRPTRVPSKLMWNGDPDTLAKSGGFVITCNAQRGQDNLVEVLRTYFAMCLQDDESNEGELKLMQDVDIFSAQELPFETFNNVFFHGMQPNPSMFKTIKNAKLFISPYRGDGLPLNAVDALMLGTPVIVRDTITNRAVFNWNDECYYKDEMELAQKIKYFSDISTSDPAYIRIVQDGFDAVRQSHSAENSLSSLIYMLQG